MNRGNEGQTPKPLKHTRYTRDHINQANDVNRKRGCILSFVIIRCYNPYLLFKHRIMLLCAFIPIA